MSEKVGVIVRDPGGKLFKEIKDALVENKTLTMSELNEKNRMVTANSDEEQAIKKMQHTATISLALILGQMWQEHKTIDTEERPVEFAISLRSMPPVAMSGPRVAYFRAEAMWLQKVNGEDKTFHAYGPAFSAEDLNKGVNMTAMFRKIVEGIRSKQAEIDEQQIAP